MLTSAGAAGSAVPLPERFKGTSSYDAAVVDVRLLAGALTLVLLVVVIIELSMPCNSGGWQVHQNNVVSSSALVTHLSHVDVVQSIVSYIPIIRFQ